MSSVNEVTLIGRLTRDPETKETAGGTLARIGLATNETWTDRNGQRQEKTEYHNITAFGKTAELCAQYLSTGRQVYIKGKLETRTYQDRDGVERKSTEIKANQVVFLSGGENRQQGGHNNAPRQQQASGGGWNNNRGGGNGWNNNSSNNDPIPF